MQKHTSPLLDSCIKILDNPSSSYEDKHASFVKAQEELTKLKNNYDEVKVIVDIFKNDKKIKGKKTVSKEDNISIKDIEKLIKDIDKIAKKDSTLKDAVLESYDILGKIDRYIVYLQEETNAVKKVTTSGDKLEMINVENLFSDK